MVWAVKNYFFVEQTSLPRGHPTVASSFMYIVE
jgi:hypothetical protein